MKRVINNNLLKIYIILWIILFVILSVFIIVIADDFALIRILVVFLSLTVYALIGSGIYQFIILRNNSKNILLNLVTYISVGFVVVCIWLAAYYFLFHIVARLFGEKSIPFYWAPPILIGIFIYIINVLFGHFILLFSKYHEKIISEEKMQKILVENRLNTLKAYINPHFLFNSLNSVNALIKSDADKAREMLINMSDYFRYSLKQKNNTFVKLKEEIENTLLYFDIEKLRFNNRINFTSEINENTENILVPVMILQPLFENIIKHAVSQTTEVINVCFSAKLKEYLEIILSNNYDENSKSKNKIGIGISTISERLCLLYERNNLMEIIKDINKFEVILKIPIDNESNNN